jgi:protein SCO1/2
MTRTPLLLALATTFALPACAPGTSAPGTSAPGTSAPGPAVTTRPAGPLPDESIYQVDAGWTAHDGRSLRLADLRGEPVLMALVFTNCASACPLVVEDMKALAHQMPEDVRDDVQFVLVSLDPARDTLEAMRHFADAHHLSDAWTLLRGTPDDVQMLAALLNVRYRPTADGQVAHSNLIHVLDPDGRLVTQQEGLGTDPAAAVAALEQALALNG